MQLSEEIAASATCDVHRRWADDAKKLEDEVTNWIGETAKILVERDDLRQECTRLKELLEDVHLYLGQVRSADFKVVGCLSERRTEQAFKLVAAAVAERATPSK